MNRLEVKLQSLNPSLFGKLNETREEVKLLLTQYIKNFPEYTDHSIEHTTEVFNIVDEILTDEELNNLNADELYVLSMASYLHDIGMCIPEDKISLIADTEELIRQRELHPDIKREHFLRDNHHTLSAKFILEEWELLKIPSEKYAKAIALVSEGHRVVDIGNPDIYIPKFFVKNGREFVCLPYLSSILRIADELDITNIRTPRLLTKYYMPDNEKSISEWNKHIVNTLRNVSENYVRFEVECSNYSMIASLEDQFNKIKHVINYCQKVIRNISNTEARKFSLKLEKVQEEYKYINFDPKGIRYSFDVDNVINAFVGENLYNEKLTSLREVIQNSIDTCRYKKTLNPDYEPMVEIIINNDNIVISDNGLGMDEFIIKNFFGKLGSSFYQELSVKKDYEAIGQFGVGVFSYFLIADYIDIETKTEKEYPLKFRLDKDPKNYFHFFQEHQRKDSGTDITLYLKSEIKILDKSLFVEYIKNKFRYIEFPLKITIDGASEKLDSQNITIENLDKLILESLKYTFKYKFKDILTLKFDINCEKYDASVVYFYDKKLTFKPILQHFNRSSIFKETDKYSPSKIEISQKGVFINNYNNLSISDAYVKINFKQKILDLQISRNDFNSNEESIIILNDIASKIIEHLFNHFKSSVKKSKLPEISHNFIESIFPMKYGIFMEAIPLHTYIKLYHNNSIKIILLKDFMTAKIESFYISSNPFGLEQLIDKDKYVFDFFGKQDNYSLMYGYGNYVSVFNHYGYYEHVFEENGFYYTKMVYTDNKQDYIIDRKWKGFNFIESSINKLTANVILLNNLIIDDYVTNGEFGYNINHKCINSIYKYLISNKQNLHNNVKDLISEILELIPYTIEDELSETIKQLNKLTIELQSLTDIKAYKFTKKDFS